MTAGGYRGAAVVAVLVLVGALGSVPVASGGTAVASADAASDANEAPLADAGLDQEVPVNATVYLDASGSRDPDGSIESYEWSIERPDGDRMEPACADCARTEFRVTTSGTYEVTVTVTDDDDATSSDTLYVEANEIEGPSVEVSGPVDVTANTSVTFTATAQAGANELANVEWTVDETKTADRQLTGESGTDDLTTRFDPGTHELSVQVVSELGRTDTATLTVDVAERPDRPCESATWNRTGGRWDASSCGGDHTAGDGARDVFSTSETADNTTVDGEACYNDQSETARTWENANPTEQYGCHNDRILGGQTPSIRDSTGDGTLQLGDVTLTTSQIERLAARNDGVSLETGGSGFGTLEFESQDVYEEVMDTSSIDSHSVSESNILGAESTTGVWDSSFELESGPNNGGIDPDSEAAEARVPEHYNGVFNNGGGNRDISRNGDSNSDDDFSGSSDTGSDSSDTSSDSGSDVRSSADDDPPNSGGDRVPDYYQK